MSKQNGNRYSKAFRQNAVRLLLTSKKPTAQVARQLGVSDCALGTWKREALRNAVVSQPGRSGRLSASPLVLERENLRLKNELKTVRLHRDISKQILGLTFRKSGAERFAVIQKFAMKYSVKDVCRVLGLARSGYYRWLSKAPRQRRPLRVAATRRRQLVESRA